MFDYYTCDILNFALFCSSAILGQLLWWLALILDLNPYELFWTGTQCVDYMCVVDDLQNGATNLLHLGTETMY